MPSMLEYPQLQNVPRTSMYTPGSTGTALPISPPYPRRYVSPYQPIVSYTANHTAKRAKIRETTPKRHALRAQAEFTPPKRDLPALGDFENPIELEPDPASVSGPPSADRENLRTPAR